MEIYQEIFPNVWFGWAGNEISFVVPLIGRPEEEAWFWEETREG